MLTIPNRLKTQNYLESVFSPEGEARSIEESFVTRLLGIGLPGRSRQQVNEEQVLTGILKEGMFDKVMLKIIDSQEAAADEKFDDVKAFRFSDLKLK